MNVMQTLSLSLWPEARQSPEESPAPPCHRLSPDPPPKTMEEHTKLEKKRVKIKKCLDTKGYIVIKVDAHDVQGLLSFTGKVSRV